MVEHWAVVQEVAGLNLARINTQDVKITEEKVPPLQFHLQMGRLEFQVFLNKAINCRPLLTSIFYVHKFSVGC